MPMILVFTPGKEQHVWLWNAYGCFCNHWLSIN